MDILKETRKFIQRIAEADRRAAELRARTDSIIKELASFSKSKHTRHRQEQGEAVTAKREILKQEAAAFLHGAE